MKETSSRQYTIIYEFKLTNLMAGDCLIKPDSIFPPVRWFCHSPFSTRMKSPSEPETILDYSSLTFVFLIGRHGTSRILKYSAWSLVIPPSNSRMAALSALKYTNSPCSSDFLRLLLPLLPLLLSIFTAKSSDCSDCSRDIYLYRACLVGWFFH